MAAAGRLMNMHKVVLMMVMVVAVMQLQVPMVQTRHLIATSTSSTAAAAPPAPAPAPAPEPVSISRSSSEGGGPVTYIVGDSFGWTVPGDATTYYSTWASDKTFNVGDVLVFNFANQAHTVTEVITRTAFDSCSSETTTSSTSKPARIALTRPGPHYFICTVPQHCSLGQKLAINVTRSSSSSATTPPPSPSINAASSPPASSTSTSTPSAPSSPPPDVINYAPPAAPSSGPPPMMAALPGALLSIALACRFLLL